MSRTFRRVKHFYAFYGRNYNDAVVFFSDNYKTNSRMLSTIARQLMRTETRNRIKNEFLDYAKRSDWDNYCTIINNRYSDSWSYD